MNECTKLVLSLVSGKSIFNAHVNTEASSKAADGELLTRKCNDIEKLNRLNDCLNTLTNINEMTHSEKKTKQANVVNSKGKLIAERMEKLRT